MSSWDPKKTTVTIYKLSPKAKQITGHDQWEITNHYQPVPYQTNTLYCKHTLVRSIVGKEEPKLFAFHNNYGSNTDTLATICVQEWEHGGKLLKMFEIDKDTHFELWCEEDWTFGKEVRRYANEVWR